MERPLKLSVTRTGRRTQTNFISLPFNSFLVQILNVKTKIYEIITFPVVSYGYEIWSLTLKE
jgi:hypothetical protein